RTLTDLPDELDPVLWAPMQLGNALAPLAVGAGAWLKWHRWQPAAGAMVVGLSGWWLAKGVKAAVRRGRPAAELAVKVRAGAPHDGLGFVSGHSTVAFGLATVLAPYLRPSHRIAAYALATVVASARIHVGAHLPLDTVGGAALGCLIGSAWDVFVGTPGASLARR